MVKITLLQNLWLYSRGGRTLEDIFIRKRKIGVMMNKKSKEYFLEIPSDKYILNDYHVVKSIPERYTTNNSPLVLRHNKYH